MRQPLLPHKPKSCPSKLQAKSELSAREQGIHFAKHIKLCQNPLVVRVETMRKKEWYNRGHLSKTTTAVAVESSMDKCACRTQTQASDWRRKDDAADFDKLLRYLARVKETPSWWEQTMVTLTTKHRTVPLQRHAGEKENICEQAEAKEQIEKSWHRTPGRQSSRRLAAGC
jgi:hypothetical protein